MRLTLGLAWLCAAVAVHEKWPSSQTSLLELRNRTAALFYHAWDSYAAHALPADELRPLSCKPVGPDTDRFNIQRNDVMGNFSLTLLDSLDMFPILGRDDLFAKYVDLVGVSVSFDVDSVVQVFEATIRALGGLLSAHLYASVPELGHSIENYDGCLLRLAADLAERLLPAFETPSGIPHPRVHLQKGVIRNVEPANISRTNPAGAGTALLEFGLLSRLTGDPRFEKKARRAFFKVWNRRSALDLVAMDIDANSGNWLTRFSGVGANIDSFYEYALKYHILFDDPEFLSIWKTIYSSVSTRLSSRWFKHVVDFSSGSILTYWIDALGAFWPGLEVLAGNVVSAVHTHLGYYKLWNQYGGLPERWSTDPSTKNPVLLEWYLLRPEFVESNYYLYQATKDPFYLRVGECILQDLEKINKVQCGVAAVQDVRTGALSDRMDSFFLSETIKYLYLLFHDDNSLNTDGSRFVFSTEAHPFWSSPKVLLAASTKRFHKVTTRQAAAFRKHSLWKRALNRIKDRWLTVQQGVGYSWCSVFPKSRNIVVGSVVCSWDKFYALDSQYNYTKPRWLYRTEDIELDPGFYRHNVHPKATCRNEY